MANTVNDQIPDGQPAEESVEVRHESQLDHVGHETAGSGEVSSVGEDPGEGEGPVEDEGPETALHPIKVAIDGFLHRVLDIEDGARSFVVKASVAYRENAERLTASVTKLQEVLDLEENADVRLAAIRSLQKSVRDIDRHNNSSPVETIEKSLFIYLFAAFDKYVGDLMAALFHLNPSLYDGINREVSLSEALKFDSMELLRESILEKEIEALRRKSYLDQFKDLGNRFSIELTKFDEWPAFVESAQRRNLFTHCDGVVSQQYLEVCKQVRYRFETEPQVGEQLPIGGEYFFSACDRIMVVAIMLGQTLWRKLLPSELAEADSHLSGLVFDFLHMEEWPKSMELSKFAIGLPRRSSDQMHRMITVNYAIALKAIGNAAAAKNVLDRLDWSASTYDFKLAYAVLTDDFASAKTMMLRIGKMGELVHELAYHDWPLFREFRGAQEFFDGYAEVYGYKYATKLTTIAEEKKSEVDVREKGGGGVTAEVGNSTAAG